MPLALLLLKTQVRLAQCAGVTQAAPVPPGARQDNTGPRRHLLIKWSWVETILVNRGSAIQPSRVASRVEQTENDRGGAIESTRFREIASTLRE